MVQTSNGVMNNSLYDLITQSSLLAWQRVRVASAIASSGKEWWEAFKTHASGTYVNQYMVTDFKLFMPGAEAAATCTYLLLYCIRLKLNGTTANLSSLTGWYIVSWPRSPF